MAQYDTSLGLRILSILVGRVNVIKLLISRIKIKLSYICVDLADFLTQSSLRGVDKINLARGYLGILQFNLEQSNTLS